jgi:transposase
MIGVAIDAFVTRPAPTSTARPQMPEETALLLAAVQSELVGVKAEMVAKVATLEDTIANLAQENALLKRRLFGNKTERSHTTEAQLALGDLLAAEAQLQKELDAAVAATKQDAGVEDSPSDDDGPTNKPKGRRELLASKLPHCPVEFLDEELEAKGCRRIGFDESSQLMYRRGGFVVLVKRVARYEVMKDGEASLATATTPETLFPRAMLHTSMVAHLMATKFGLGVPHHRLELDFAGQGLTLDRGTMCRYMEHAGNTLGATIVQAMWSDAIANAQVISTDATGAMIQPGKGGKAAKDGRAQACKKGHFFTAVVDCDAILFEYVEQHSSESVKELFGDFSGYLQADASNVYDVLERGPPKDTDGGVILVGCFAHLRRYFFEAAICRYPIGLQGLMRIRAIYAADQAVMRAPAAARQALRERHVRPLMIAFFEWVKAARTKAEGRNLATKALGYAVNQETELMRVLKDINLPLDNTRSERALRKIVVGRKAWMFYGSDTHAEAAAAIFSLIASCRLHRLDPFTYLDEVMRVLPYWSRDRYLELAPKYWTATRAALNPKELASPLSAFKVPDSTSPSPLPPAVLLE